MINSSKLVIYKIVTRLVSPIIEHNSEMLWIGATKSNPNPHSVLFFSENIYHYYRDNSINEYSIIEAILEHLKLEQPT